MMIVFNANNMPSDRRPMASGTRMAGPRMAGLVVGLLAGISAAQAAPQTAPTAPAVQPPAAIAAAPAVAPTPSNDPSKQLPGTISVANIDFKRGDGGSGKLIVRFSGEGALPDMRSQGAQVMINVGNAQLPASLQRPLNVADFATPVQRIDARTSGTGAQLVLNTSGAYDTMAYQTGRDYIVEVVPRTAQSGNRAVGAAATAGGAKPASGAAPTSGSISAPAPVARTYGGRPVTFNFQDVPVRTVLQLVAEESNLNIVAADTVQGNVTLRLVNVPWDQALDIVLQAKGLDKRRSGNVVWVAPQAEVAKYEQDREDARIALDNRVDLTTEYVQVNYHNAAQIYKALTEAKGIGSGGSGGETANSENGFLSPRGRLVADERTNTLMISDIPKKVAQMKELIRVIDRPVDQVLIEARIVIANESFARDLGARFGVSGQKGDVITSGTLESINNYRNTAAKNSLITQQANKLTDDARLFDGVDNAKATSLRDQARSLLQTITNPAFLFPASLNTNLPAATSGGALAFTILGKFVNLDMEFSAMQTEGRGEVVSNPRVVTSNQREAVISQGQEVGYVTISPQQGGNSIPIPNVQFKDVLMEMKVNPTITNDGRVFLNMNVKKDEVEGFIDTSIGQVPRIAKRNINTAVLVEDGQTVVIGGVYEFKDRTDLSKVPFLADIPFLGNLFKKKSRSKEKAELLIFVTPKVMKVSQR
ncbi:type IV pilus secretin PilQ [Lysobacter gummosus]|uniref:Type IV pilus secretin PilQ n=1 Tax=Lysobacter gummosus TaxID=262324 RepID=A0ABY3XFY5_9GAMM|nr:type IV pilus secretin PilQ [Lysobacter gummosus]ALN89955.1 type IV pilus secretin PilQ family protein [Lysobacter gummosus]UNP30542.1 type IV pilus secretin PilQ [Lysobacter gummosus]